MIPKSSAPAMTVMPPRLWQTDGSSIRNTALTGLAVADLAHIRPHLTYTKFHRLRILQEQNRTIEQISFVEAGLVSLRRNSAGKAIEISTLGTSGVIGLSALLGVEDSVYQFVSMTSGTLLSIRTKDFLCLAAARPQIRQHLLSYVPALLLQSSQVALCGLHHQLEQRLAGWLCEASDSVGGTQIPVTHDYLATILGLPRSGITRMLIRFESDRLISRARGVIQILDRRHLIEKACRCYSTITELNRCASS